MDEAKVQKLISIIDASRTADNEQHRKVFEEVARMETDPEFNGYLAFVFAGNGRDNRPNIAVDTRQRAGLLLRTNIKKHFKTCPTEVRDFTKKALLSIIGDEARPIRLTLGSVVATLLSDTLEKGLDIWPDIFAQLADQMKSSGGNSNTIDSALNITSKAFTDMGVDLMTWQNRVDPIVPLVIALHRHDIPNVRAQSLNITYQMLYSPPPTFYNEIENVIGNVFQLTQDSDRNVRKNVCKCLVALLEHYMEKMSAHMEDIIRFHIACSQQTSDEEICLEGTEFWNTYATHLGTDKSVLAPFLPQLVPVLLKNMVYSDMQIAEFDMQNDDTSITDRAENLKPSHHKSKWDGGDEDDNQEQGSSDTDWNIRKCSARSLDNLSNVYGDNLLVVLLPEIDKVLKSEQWSVRESGILALGAIAHGCGRGIEQYLPELIKFMFNLMDDGHPLIRSMSCWSVARYADWMFHVDKDMKQYCEPLLKKLLERINDNSKKVQDAACAALAAVVETAHDRLQPYLEHIVLAVDTAFGKYKLRNMPVLYDVCITLFENCQSLAQNPTLSKRFCDHVMRHFMACDDNDQRIFGILDTLMTFVLRMGPNFMPYVEHLVRRSLTMANSVMQECGSAVVSTKEELKAVKQRKEFLICSLDVLSATCEGVGAGIENIFRAQMGNMLEVLLRAVQDNDNPHVKRSAFALLGDLYHVTPDFVKSDEVSDKFLKCAIRNMNPYNSGVCINSLWTVGEATSVLKEKMQPYCEEIVKQVAGIFNAPDQITERRVKDNSAIILARLAMYLPKDVATHATSFKTEWVSCLMHYPEDDEKARAFVGLLKVIEANPDAVCSNIDDLTKVVMAVCAWRKPPEELDGLFRQLLGTFVGCLGGLNGDNWKNVCGRLPPEIKERLKTYNFLSG